MNGRINHKDVEFSAGQTILEVARNHGHFIPTLCEMSRLHHSPGACRVCLVEIKRRNDPRQYLVTSCNTPMEEGMVVLTRSKRVRDSQRLQVEMLLADHDQDCASCVRHGNCELQDVAQFVGLQQTRYQYPAFYKERTKDYSSAAVVRDMSKCIRCNRCVAVCRGIQGTDVLVFSDKGLSAEIGVRDGLALGTSECVGCGQCTLVCPVGALAEHDDIEQVIDYLYDPDIFTVFQFAPASRIALGEEFHMPPGVEVTGKMVTALKKLGADVVLDTNFGADLVIMEESALLLERIKTGQALPMISSCSSSWINYIEKNYPEQLEQLSTTKSPQQCFGAIAKTYLAQKLSVDAERMRVVSISPCTAKKEEAKRPEMASDGRPDVDVVLTTREFARLIRREGLWLPDLEDSPFDDNAMGRFSGAAELFGSTGGVMEGVLRTVHFMATGREIPGVEFSAVRGYSNLREAEIDLGEGIGKLKVAVVDGLIAAKKMIESVRDQRSDYRFIEVMGCPGGCIGGGGQPRIKKDYQNYRTQRQQAVYRIDREAEIRQAHNNPLIQALYSDFLQAPLQEKSQRLLHTGYRNRQRKVRHSIKEIWEEIKEGN